MPARPVKPAILKLSTNTKMEYCHRTPEARVHHRDFLPKSYLYCSKGAQSLGC